MSGNYYLSIGYLRGFVMLLVLGHHSVLSYQGYFGYVGHDLLSWQTTAILRRIPAVARGI